MQPTRQSPVGFHFKSPRAADKLFQWLLAPIPLGVRSTLCGAYSSLRVLRINGLDYDDFTLRIFPAQLINPPSKTFDGLRIPSLDALRRLLLKGRKNV